MPKPSPLGTSTFNSTRERRGQATAYGHSKTHREGLRLGQGSAGLRKTRHRGIDCVGWQFTFTMAACNLIRLPKLLASAS